ncbi:transglutaminase domain-containing protein [Butyrivibrio sp. AE3004]|uniref:transglutaminase domain-containing protein n=1 Tax=Butyrivibrio sp. AE3004 TaxID=1506994 RepID=UPI0004940210|nr:transglutaminase domain-containing protein [Butyrivibrio sp. AE3004]
MRQIKKILLHILVGIVIPIIIAAPIHPIISHAYSNTWTATNVGSGRNKMFSKLVTSAERYVYEFAINYAYEGDWAYPWTPNDTKLTTTQCNNVMLALNCDYPEVYWYIYCSSTYLYVAKDCRFADYNNAFAKKYKISGPLDSKLRKIFYMVAKNIIYSTNTSSYTYIDHQPDGTTKVSYNRKDQLPEGLFSGRGVCCSYARAFQLFCNVNDIECVTVQGSAYGTGHIWNIVKYNGKWQLVDATDLSNASLDTMENNFLASENQLGFTRKNYSIDVPSTSNRAHKKFSSIERKQLKTVCDEACCTFKSIKDSIPRAVNLSETIDITYQKGFLTNSVAAPLPDPYTTHINIK